MFKRSYRRQAIILHHFSDSTKIIFEFCLQILNPKYQNQINNKNLISTCCKSYGLMQLQIPKIQIFMKMQHFKHLEESQEHVHSILCLSYMYFFAQSLQIVEKQFGFYQFKYVINLLSFVCFLKQMRQLQLVILLITFFGMVICPDDPFCFPLCQQDKCKGEKQDDCESCRSGFEKKSGSSEDYCILKSIDQYTTSPRYQPIGVDPELTKDIEGNLTVQDITVSGAGFGGICDDYSYYGDLDNNDKVNLQITDVETSGSDVYFYKLRLLYWVITIDKWDDDAELVTTFKSVTPEVSKQTSLDKDDMFDRQKYCGDDDDREGYIIIDEEFEFSDSTFSPIEFQISVKDNGQNNPWGVKDFIIFVKKCHPYCTKCTGSDKDDCSQCNFFDQDAMLSGTTCDRTCLDGYGYDPSNRPVCLTCSQGCKTCYASATNCSVCYNSHILYDNGTDVICVTDCPDGTFQNATANPNVCSQCNSTCLTCVNRDDKCTSCHTDEYLYQDFCYNPCPDGTWADDGNSKCVNCNAKCTLCANSSTNCSECTLTGGNKAFLLVANNQCTKNCGAGFYKESNGGLGPNICQACFPACATCDINSTYCQSCNPTYYYFALENSCDDHCDEPIYFPDNSTWSCLACEDFCVGLDMELSFMNSLKTEMLLDLTFTDDLDWDETDLEAFITIQQDSDIISLDYFNIAYSVLSPKHYRVTIEPKGYIFLYNVTFTFTTMTFPGAASNLKAINDRPFKNTSYHGSPYEQIRSLIWFVIVAPDMTQMETSIVDGLSKMSDKVLDVTTQPYMQEIKKSGVFALLMGGAQATSMAILVNSIPSQNFYEGARFWSSFVHFDVPNWEQNSDKTKYVVADPVQQYIQNARLLQSNTNVNSRKLFDTSSIQWRFQRTGRTSFFIFDCYMSVALIVLCWILMIIGKCCFKNKKTISKWMSRFYSFTHKVHQISLLYITIATLLEWIYFDAASVERWISMGICLLFNLYFLAYELFIYYQMIDYPHAQIGNAKYDHFVLRYGFLLKNIRFEEYDPKQEWSYKQWFRPYNFHILSYYKKLLMLAALPIFYETKHAQIFALITLQLLEIIRLLIVWPFKSRVRNIIRLFLDSFLLLFFISVLIQGYMVAQIMKNDDSTLQSSISLFYQIGWMGFVAIFIFNIGHIIIFIYDTLRGCRMTNRQLMDEARKQYYMQKLNTYQEENEDVPIEIVNKWVKMGNLNNRKYDQLPDINLRVEYFRILKNSRGYQIEMKKLFEVFMNIQFTFNQENNLTASKKLNKRFTLTKSLSSHFFGIIDELYNKYINQMDFQYLTLKTFLRVQQSQFKPGEKIPFKIQDMTQKIELETYVGQIKQIKLPQVLKDFPLQKEIFNQII